MGYPHDQLADGEYVVLHQHPHWKELIPAAASCVATVVVASFLATLTAGWDGRQVLWIALAVLGVISVAWFSLTPLLRWLTTHFVVTSDKVMFREGVLARTGMNIPLSRIASVRFEHSITDRIFGCGTLLIESASHEPLAFGDIPAIERVHAVLYQQAVDGTPAAPAGV